MRYGGTGVRTNLNSWHSGPTAYSMLAKVFGRKHLANDLQLRHGGELPGNTMPSMHIRGTETKAARQSPEVWSSDILRRRQDQEIKSIIATRPTRIRSWGLHP